ncbi:MAG: energy-coupling factor transporter transmembrane component T, partial [Oscillospiraceae bacterium]
KALVPLLVPLFISAFRRADELAIAMECRCYHGGDGRTRMRQLKFRWFDFVTLFVTLLLCVGIWLLRHFGI